MSCCYVFYTAAVTLVSGSPSGRGIDTAQGIEETLPGVELVPFSFVQLRGHPLGDGPAFFVVRVVLIEFVLPLLVTWLNVQYRLTDIKRRLALCALVPHY